MLRQLLLPFSKPLAYVTPTSWAKAIWEKSWTKLLGWVQGISGALLFTLSQLNTYITDPSFKSYLDIIDVPKSVTIALAVIGLVTWLAHGRSDD